MIHHFILTRFNLALWSTDKTKKSIDRNQWLVERMKLFETYCLPSIASQTSKNFTWIILCDNQTPDEQKQRIKAYKDQCPQIHLIWVKPEASWHFAQIFPQVIAKLLQEAGFSDDDICLTTYLDNDDALNTHFVEDIQKQSSVILPRTFINYDKGLQYFTKFDVVVDVNYKNSHFLTLKETIKPNHPNLGIRTCFGYGSHAVIESKHIAPVFHAQSQSPMWLEVVHDSNVINDINLRFKPTIHKNNPNILQQQYNIPHPVHNTHTFLYHKSQCAFIIKRIIAKIKGE